MLRTLLVRHLRLVQATLTAFVLFLIVYVVMNLNNDRAYVQYLHTIGRFHRRRSAFVGTMGFPAVLGESQRRYVDVIAPNNTLMLQCHSCRTYVAG